MKKEAFCFGDSEISRKGQTAEVEAVDTSWGGEEKTGSWLLLMGPVVRVTADCVVFQW